MSQSSHPPVKALLAHECMTTCEVWSGRASESPTALTWSHACPARPLTHSLTLTPSHMSIDDQTTYDIEQMKEEKEGTSDVVT